MPILCCSDQLNWEALHPRKSWILMVDSRGGVMAQERPSQRGSQTLHQSTATETVLQGTIKLAHSREGTWVFPPGQTYIIPLDSIIFEGSSPPWRRDVREQWDIAGILRKVICFYLTLVTLLFCLVPSSPPPPLFLFLFLSLCLSIKQNISLFFFAATSNLVFFFFFF